MAGQNKLSRPAMNASSDVIYTLDSQLCISYCNPAWDRFARANGGERALSIHVIGRSVFDFIPTPLQAFYEGVFRRGRVAQLDYDCSSADTYRLHRMIVLKQPDNGFAIVNAKRIERPHDQRAVCVPGECHVSHGVVTMCAHCRRSRRCGVPGSWDWVPALVSDRAQKLNYELCPICDAYFFSNGTANWAQRKQRH